MGSERKKTHSTLYHGRYCTLRYCTSRRLLSKVMQTTLHIRRQRTVLLYPQLIIKPTILELVLVL